MGSSATPSLFSLGLPPRPSFLFLPPSRLYLFFFFSTPLKQCRPGGGSGGDDTLSESAAARVNGPSSVMDEIDDGGDRGLHLGHGAAAASAAASALAAYNSMTDDERRQRLARIIRIESAGVTPRQGQSSVSRAEAEERRRRRRAAEAKGATALQATVNVGELKIFFPFSLRPLPCSSSTSSLFLFFPHPLLLSLSPSPSLSPSLSLPIPPRSFSASLHGHRHALDALRDAPLRLVRPRRPGCRPGPLQRQRAPARRRARDAAARRPAVVPFARRRGVRSGGEEARGAVGPFRVWGRGYRDVCE